MPTFPNAPLGIKAEIALPAWTDFSTLVYQRNPVNITRGRQNQSSTLSPGQASFTVNNTDGRWQIRNPTGPWYGQLVQSSPVRFSVPSSLAGIPCYLRLETDTASYASAPDMQTTATLAQAAVTNHATASTVTVTLGSQTGGASHKSGINTVVVMISAFSTGTNPTVSGVTLGGSADNFAQVATASGTQAFNACWADSACAGGQTSVVVNLTGGSGTLGLNVAVFEVNGNWQLDQTASVAGAASTSFSVGATPGLSQADEFAVGMVTVDSSTATLTGPGAPWTNLAQITNSVTAAASTLVGWQATSTIAGVTYAGSISASLAYEGLVVTFKGGSPLAVSSGTISVRVDCKITDWTGNHVLAAKAGANGLAWALWTNGDGTLDFGHWDVNANAFATPSTLPVPYFGQRIAIRADYNIGAQTVTFYTAPTMAGSWTQLGAAAATAATSQNSATGQAVQVGAGTTTLAGMYGEVYEAQVLSTGTLLADPVFTSQTPGATSFADAQSNTWTLAGTSELSGRLYRFHGELNSLPKAADPSLTDVWSDAAAGGVTQRLQQQQTPAQSAMRRAYVRLPSSLQLAAYWPCEDMSGATQIGQAVGQHAMSSAGMTMASSTAFACSSALPVMATGGYSAVVDPNSVTWTDNVGRCLLAVPAAGDTSGGVVMQLGCSGGPVGLVVVTYQNQFGGTLQAFTYSPTGTLLNNTAAVNGFALNGNPSRVSVSLKQNGGNVDIQLEVLHVGSTTTQLFTAASIVAGTLGSVNQISGSGLPVTAIGHISVQGKWDSLFDLNGALNAWFGETAGARFSRLCGEESIPCRITGPPDVSQKMGNQTQQTILQLLQEIETTDQGLITEPRQVLGVGYVTQRGMCQQPPLATASFSSAALAAAFTPASDFQLLVNDVTMTGTDGSIARRVLTTGGMSVNAPTASPPGAGRYDTSVTVNPQYDSALDLLAGWFLHVRSVDDDRYPVIPFDMARSETPQSIPLLDVGNYLKITGTPAWVPPGPVKQLVAGYTETLGPYAIWTTQLNGIPETPYEIAVANDPNYGHLGTAGSTVHAGATFGAGTFQADTNTGPLWSTSGGDYPVTLVISGMTLTVSGCSGASNPQTFTVSSWGVNGVTKNLTAGQSIRVATPATLAL